jgi:predicted glycoside hydrolase/deacetylase ChbG (UPF0249 family)
MPAATSKPVIICADDYAFSAGVSDGIVQLAAAGRLGATSAMVLSPRWAADAERLKDLRGCIDVGLHLDWTSAFAVRAGHGMPLRRAMLASLTGGFAGADVTRVIEQQLDAFEARWGAAPDHVDGHQHVQQFDGIRGPLLDVLDRRYGAGAGPYLRVSRPVGGGLKGRVIGALGAHALLRDLSGRKRAFSPALTGLYGFDGTTADYAARAAKWLREAPAGAVLMCHPASQAEPGDPIAAARIREFDFWRSDAASEALAQAGAVHSRGRGLRPAAR